MDTTDMTEKFDLMSAAIPFPPRRSDGEKAMKRGVRAARDAYESDMEKVIKLRVSAGRDPYDWDPNAPLTDPKAVDIPFDEGESPEEYWGWMLGWKNGWRSQADLKPQMWDAAKKRDDLFHSVSMATSRFDVSPEKAHIIRAFNMGMINRYAGVALTANPYDDRGLATFWENGWDFADHDTFGEWMPDFELMGIAA